MVGYGNGGEGVSVRMEARARDRVRVRVGVSITDDCSCHTAILFYLQIQYPKDLANDEENINICPDGSLPR